MNRLARGVLFPVGLLGITALAAGLRLYDLDAAGFWVDELHTVRHIASGRVVLSKQLGYLPTELGLWLSGVDVSELREDQPEHWKALGVTETRARLASCLIGIATVPILAVASYKLLGARTTLILALLLAISPWHVSWSRMSRFYTQQFLFYNLALLWYFHATQGHSRWRMAAAVAALVLAFLSQPPALIVCLVLAADWGIGLFRQEKVRLGYFGWISLTFGIVLCAAFLAADQLGRPDMLGEFVDAGRQSPLRMILGPIRMMHLPLAAFAVPCMVMLLVDRSRLGVYWCLAAVLPLLALSVLAGPMYVDVRYALICLYAWLAVVAIGASRAYEVIRPQAGWALAAAPLVMLAGSLMLENLAYHRSLGGFNQRYRDAFQYVTSHRQSTDLVYGPPQPARYYLEDATVRDFPRDRRMVHTGGRNAWFVVEESWVLPGGPLAWIAEKAELRAYFDTLILRYQTLRRNDANTYLTQPFSSIRVYRLPVSR